MTVPVQKSHNQYGALPVWDLSDLYPAREQPVEGVSSALIADKMREAGKAPVWEGPRADAAQAISEKVRANDVVITIGAGDITRTGPELLDLLAKERD